MPSFGPIAPFYDQLMHAVPYSMWASYYELLLTQQAVRPSKLLDVCCGTGSVAELLSTKGYRVSGIDLSEPMIVEARRKAEAAGLDIRYEVADAAAFSLTERFDAAYSFFDSLNYITDLGRVGMAFERIAEHLLPGGSLVFDLNTAYAFEQRMFDQMDTRQRTKVKYHWQGDYDPGARIIRVAMEFWVDGERYKETHVQRAHSQDEIVDLLETAGFEEISVFDAYTLDRPRKRSDRIHYAALLPRNRGHAQRVRHSTV
jgi:ubiquinone/menaquinone biosynthesis C-methylase UbiE